MGVGFIPVVGTVASAAIGAENASGAQRRNLLKNGVSEKDAGKGGSQIAAGAFIADYGMSKLFGGAKKRLAKNELVQDLYKPILKSVLRKNAAKFTYNTVKNSLNEYAKNLNVDYVGKKYLGDKKWNELKKKEGRGAYSVILKSILDSFQKGD